MLGENYQGQLGLDFGAVNETNSATTVLLLENNPMDISLGREHSCLQDVLSKVFCWGRNSQGQLGSNDYVTRYIPNEVSLESNVVKIAAGMDHTCIINILENVWCWGQHNYYKQLGIAGTNHNSITPIEVTTLSNIYEIYLRSAQHTCAIDNLFQLYCWGQKLEWS